MSKSNISPVLVGRRREMGILDQALQAAQNGTGRCILLSGEAGIGKSRLAAELSDRAVVANFQKLKGYCSEQDGSFLYAPWIDALRAFFATLSPAETNALLGAFAPELVKLLPEISLVMPSIKPTPPLDPAAEKHRLFESLTRFTTSLTTAQPLLIILEDLHWSDELSLEFLHFIIRRIAAVPILILGSYRSEDSSQQLAYHLAEINREPIVEEIQIAPLTRSDVEQMVQAILKTENPISHDWLDLLMPLTEGNPFFVEEITKSLARTEAQSVQWDPFQIPRSIQQTVRRRVEELPERARTILSLAAVIGERFDFALLQEVAVENERSLLRVLKELITAQLIVEQTTDQFAFRHALTREVVYATIILRERKEMHQVIGEAMEHIVGAQTEALAAPLAYHFYQAGNWQKAMEYSQRSGELAQALYAPREALVHFSHALDASEHLGLPMPPACLRGRAQARELLGDFEGARADFEAVLELAQRHADRVDEWHGLIDLGLLWQSRNLERAGEYYQRALELAQNLEDDTVMAVTLNRLGNWYYNYGRAHDALPYHREALVLYQKRDDKRGIAHTMDLLGIVSYQLGEVIQGANYLEDVVPILRELDDRQGLFNTLTNLTVRAISDTEVLGEIDFRQLVDLSDEALQIARSFNWYQGEMHALMQGVICLERVGEYRHALERLSQAEIMAEEGRNRESFARLHLVSGQIFYDMYALTEAKGHFEIGLAYLQELGSGLLILAAKVNLASVAISQNDIASAKALLADLLHSEYPESQEQMPLRKCWSTYAELELALDNPRYALGIIDRLLAATPNLAEYGPHAIPRLSLLRAQALAALGEMEEAKAELQGTIPVARRQGIRPVLWRLHADLGNVLRAMRRRAEAEREFSDARAIIQELADQVSEDVLRENFLRQAQATIPSVHELTPRQAAKSEYGGLTTREREIAALIAQGKSNRDIAKELVISEKTAERHVANILLKLGFKSRTQVAAWVVDKRLDK